MDQTGKQCQACAPGDGETSNTSAYAAPNDDMNKSFRRTVVICCILAVGIAITAWVGWASGFLVLASIRWRYVPMDPTSAGFIILASVALFVRPARPVLARGLVLVLAAMAVYAIVISGWFLLVQNPPIPDPITASWFLAIPMPVGLVSPLNICVLALASAAMALLTRRQPSRRCLNIVGIFATIIACGTGIVVIGYLYDEPLLYSGGMLPMPATTAITNLCLALAITLSAGHTSVPLKYFCGQSARAQLLRVFLPLTISAVLVQSLLDFCLYIFPQWHRTLSASVSVVLFTAVTGFIVARVSHAIGSAMDLSESRRKQAQEELVRTYHLLHDTFDAIPDLLSVQDSQFNVLFSNWHSSRFVPEDLRQGNPKCYQVYAGRDRPCEDCQVANVFQTNASFHDEYVDTFDGRVKSGHTFPIRDSQGKPIMVVEHVRDVTDRRRMQEQLLQAQKMEAIGQLAGGIAHDFRNQLTVIKGYSEMILRQKTLDDDALESVNEIRKAAERSSVLCMELLSYSRKQMLHPEPVDLDTCVRSMSKSISRLLGDDIKLTVETTAGMGMVKIDSQQFQQAMINMVINAKDAMSAGGALTISMRKTNLDADAANQHDGCTAGDYLAVIISDTGEGMDSQTVGKIFDPFFTTKPVGKGTGLGLSMVYGFVRQSEGYINVSSRKGEGSTFELFFPLAKETTPAEKPQPTSETKENGK
jgi:signal transduction histidine kinase